MNRRCCSAANNNTAKQPRRMLMFLEPVNFQNYLLGMYMFRRTQREYYASLMLPVEQEEEKSGDSHGIQTVS